MLDQAASESTKMSAYPSIDLPPRASGKAAPEIQTADTPAFRSEKIQRQAERFPRARQEPKREKMEQPEQGDESTTNNNDSKRPA